MALSTFILGLYVLLQSAVYLAWFEVAPKFLGFVGIAFVVVLFIETFLYASGRPFVLWKRG